MYHHVAVLVCVDRSLMRYSVLTYIARSYCVTIEAQRKTSRLPTYVDLNSFYAVSCCC